MKTKKDFEIACKIFVEQQRNNQDVIGIIVSGSYVHGQLEENSDIDVHVILNEKCQYRERGNTWVNDIEIEFFKNTPQQIRKYFLEEKKSPHTAHMLANSIVVYNASPIIDELIKEATEILLTPRKPMKSFQIELEKYHIDDIFKDYKDAVNNEDDFSRKFIIINLINKLVDVCCQFHQVSRDKDKKLQNQLKEIDAEITMLLQNVFDAKNIKEETEYLILLKNHVENKLGGARSKEWKLFDDLS